eukprot:scaffold62806_cov74-Cyclotella_meneghiniana.AAC.4
MQYPYGEYSTELTNNGNMLTETNSLARIISPPYPALGLINNSASLSLLTSPTTSSHRSKTSKKHRHPHPLQLGPTPTTTPPTTATNMIGNTMTARY